MPSLQELSPESLKHPKIKRMHEYWQGKCAGRAMPSRADIEVLDLRDCLGNLCLVDVIDGRPRRYRFRVDGSNLANLTGFDLTGKFIDEVPEAAYRDFLIALYERVVETRAPVFLANAAEWKGFGVQEVSVTLPLSSDGTTVDGILDAVFPTRLDNG